MNKQGGFNQSNGAESIDLSRLWRLVVVKKWLVITVVLICTVLATLVGLAKKPSYQSNIILQVNSEGSVGLNLASSLNSIIGDLPMLHSQSTPGQVEQVLLSSPYILKPVIQKLHLDIAASPNYFPFLGHVLAHFYHGSKPAKPLWNLKQYAWGGEKIKVTKLNVTSQYIGKNLTLVAGQHGYYQLLNEQGQLLVKGKVGQLESSSGRNPAVTITVSQLNARPGTEFTISKLQLAQAVKNLQANLQIQEQGQGTGILQASFSSKSPSLTISVLNNLADQAQEMGLQDQQRKAQQTLRFLGKQLPEIRQSLLAAESALSEYQAKTGNLDMGTQYRLILQQILTAEEQLEELRLKKTELLQKYTESHPFVKTLEDKIGQVKKQITDYNQQLKKLPQNDKKSVELMRDVKAKNQLYLTLLSKQQELKVLAAGVSSNIKILNYAFEPPLMLAPPKALIVMVGIIIGLILSVGFIFLKLMLQNTIVDPFYIEDFFGVSVQAILPFSANQARLEKILKKRKKANAIQQTRVLAKRFPDDPVIESLRSLRTTFSLQLEHAKNKIITISGLTPAVGKSFLALNLAHVLAAAGKKVLVIDADLRRGHINDYLAVSSCPGLAELLSEKASLEEVTHHFPEDHLSFIAAGHRLNGASELFMKHSGALLNQLESMYDYIVIDTAPLLLLTDGVLLAKQAGINLLVVAAGLHTDNELKMGLNILQRNQIQLDGVVLNFSSSANSNLYANQYYGKYGYYYHTDKQG